MLDPHIQTASTLTTTFVPLVHRYGSGVLQGLAVAGGTGYHYFRVELDGQELANDYLSGILGGPAHGNNGLAVGLQFENELLVEIRGGAPSPQTVFWVSYAMDRRPSDGELETRTVDGVDHVFRIVGDETALLGPARSSRVTLSDDVWLPSETLFGSVRLQRFDGEGLYEPTVRIVARAAGRAHEFGVVSTLESVDRVKEFELGWDSMAELLFGRLSSPPFYPYAPWYQLGIELVADLPGYANYPSSVL